jgi:hypothetical protein
VQRERFTTNATRFIRSVGVFEGSYLLNQDINPGKKIIQLTYGGNAITDAQRELISRRATDFYLQGTQIEIKQGFSFSREKESVSEIDKLKGEINRLSMLLSSKESASDSLRSRMALGRQLLSEIKPLYPQISTCSYAEAREYNDKTAKYEPRVVVIFGTGNGAISNEDKTRINAWLKSRLNRQAVKTYFD